MEIVTSFCYEEVKTNQAEIDTNTTIPLKDIKAKQYYLNQSETHVNYLFTCKCW